MYHHFIITSSSYVQGIRIALHYVYNNQIDKDEIKKTIEQIQNESYQNSSYSTHMIMTSSKTWKSVVSYDPFFEDVKVVKTTEEFVRYMKSDLVLNGLDVARYILSKKKCRHLALEKLTYLCYADYLCKYGKRLFEDKVYAYRYGPVVESVYENYKHSKSVLGAGIKDYILQSRILVLEDGMERLNSINNTIAKYSNCSAWDLVSITHAQGGPWSVKDYRKENQIIDDELIVEKHHVEEDYFQSMNIQ